MKKEIFFKTILLIMSIGTYSAEAASSIEEPTGVRSVRAILGTDNTALHTKGELRAGYITFHDNGSQTTSAYALGGHIHFDTDRWNGMMLSLAAYTVLDLGINQNPLHTNPDFFGSEGKSFITLSKAYIDGKWANTELKLGRQSLDTPFADSDDIRMMPNFFTAYTLQNTDITHITLQAGYIEKMGGWENGVDSASFVDISEVLGTADTDGLYYLSALYDIDNFSISLWYYHYDDIADTLYGETGYSYTLPHNITLTLGLQYSTTQESGAALLGQKDAGTFGASFQAEFSSYGVTLMGAYNRENGKTGASDLALGGGPYFTSMEDQTLDAIGTEGEAWMLGAGYDLSMLGIENLNFGIAYGSFTAKEAHVYEAKETDIVAEYTPNDAVTFIAAFASVNFVKETGTDYSQFRLIASHTF